MPEVQAPSTGEVVATIIAKKLSDANLILPEMESIVMSKIMSGKISAQDWKLLLDTARSTKGDTEHAPKA